MTFVDNWIADKIANKIQVISLPHASNAALHAKNKLAGAYIAMRTEYGKQNHWPLDADNVDIDHYDHDPQTNYFLALQKDGLRKHLTAGMRLTKVDRLEDSLSLSMWTHAIDKPHFVAELINKKHEVAHLKAAAKAGKLWDLTRLVTAMSLQKKRSPQTKRATYVALLLTLGAAFHHTSNGAVWFFTTNGEVKRFLDRLDISYSLLASGKISYSDVGENYLAWVAVDSTYAHLQQGQPIVARLIEQGFERAEKSGVR